MSKTKKKINNRAKRHAKALRTDITDKNLRITCKSNAEEEFAALM